MNIWFWVVLLLLLAAAVMFIPDRLHRRTRAVVSKRFAKVLADGGANVSHFLHDDQRGSRARFFGILEKVSAGEAEEMRRLLLQAGMVSGQNWSFFLQLAWGGPAIISLLVAGFQLQQSAAPFTVMMHGVFAFAVVFVGMRRILRWRANLRQQAIRREIVPFLHILRMLFDSGLSFEHILQIISQQGKMLLPNLSIELGVVLKRIQAGQERGDALMAMAVPLEVAELNDTVAMLKQVTRYGGHIRDALCEYTALIEQRQISELREYVSKLSAKMTIVMVVFLFPALMIFVAGPGFVGLASALKGMR